MNTSKNSHVDDERRDLSKTRKFIYCQCLLIVTTLLCFILMEIYFAFTYHSPFEEATLLVSHRLTGFTPLLNLEGFRQEPVPAAAMGNDSTRVLFLGDSITYGDGLEDGQLRFTSLLEKRLNAESTARYHIYNAGRPGTEPHRWVGYLNRLLPIYRPDIVFAVFFLRDGTGMTTSLYGHRRHIATLRQEYTDNLLYRYSYLARVIIDHQMVEAFNKRYYRDLICSAYLGTENEQAVWRKQQESLNELAAICSQSRIPFHLVIFPILFELHGYPYGAVENQISNFAHKNNIPVISLTSGFLGKDERTLWVGPGDQHPNAIGHRIAAETLYPYLKSTLDSLAVNE